MDLKIPLLCKCTIAVGVLVLSPPSSALANCVAHCLLIQRGMADDAPEPPAHPVTEPGDLWGLGVFDGEAVLSRGGWHWPICRRTVASGG